MANASQYVDEFVAALNTKDSPLQVAMSKLVSNNLQIGMAKFMLAPEHDAWFLDEAELAEKLNDPQWVLDNYGMFKRLQDTTFQALVALVSGEPNVEGWDAARLHKEYVALIKQCVQEVIGTPAPVTKPKPSGTK